jgi:hypothetical protein
MGEILKAFAKATAPIFAGVFLGMLAYNFTKSMLDKAKVAPPSTASDKA